MVAPPEGVHDDCKLCEQHYHTVVAQLGPHKYEKRFLDDAEAQREIRRLQKSTKDDLAHVRTVLQSHGDLGKRRSAHNADCNGQGDSTYSLYVVADLLGDQFGDVLVEGVLDADLVAV